MDKVQLRDVLAAVDFVLAASPVEVHLSELKRVRAELESVLLVGLE